MTKTVVIHQPDFMPYLGFFQRFLSSDLYVVLDHVQFVNGAAQSWTHRDKIKTPLGEKWLTLNIKKSPRDTPINQVLLSDRAHWVEDNLNLLSQNYKNTPYYAEIMPRVEALYCSRTDLLIDFNLKSIEMLMDLLNVRVPMVLSSSLKPTGNKNELLVDLLSKVKATHYLSGVGAKSYMDAEIFHRAGIEVIWQSFDHPIYPQQFSGFVPNLSALDALFNCGILGSRNLLRKTT